MLADHPLITTALLKKLHTYTERYLAVCIRNWSFLWLANIYVEVFSGNMFQQQHNMFFCPTGENQPEEDITKILQQHDICGREQANNLLPDINSVLKFFKELYEKGIQ